MGRKTQPFFGGTNSFTIFVVNKHKAMEISFKVLDLIKDVANDPEFQHDYNLTHLNDEQVFNVVLVDKKLLKVALQSNLNDYQHDIRMEKESGDNCSYLVPTCNELQALVNQL